MVKVFENEKGTLVVRTKGLKQAKSPLVGAGKAGRIPAKDTSGKSARPTHVEKQSGKKK
jgi:hypothetical protein